MNSELAVMRFYGGKKKIKYRTLFKCKKKTNETIYIHSLYWKRIRELLVSLRGGSQFVNVVTVRPMADMHIKRSSENKWVLCIRLCPGGLAVITFGWL